MKFFLFIIIIIFNFKTLYADENLKGKQILCGKISLDNYEIESFEFISDKNIESVHIRFIFLTDERFETTFEYQYKLEPKRIKIFLYDQISTKEWKYNSSLNRRNLSITLNNNNEILFKKNDCELISGDIDLAIDNLEKKLKNKNNRKIFMEEKLKYLKNFFINQFNQL